MEWILTLISLFVSFSGLSVGPLFGDQGISQLDQWRSTSTPFVAITTQTHSKDIYAPYSNATTSKLTATVLCLTADTCRTTWPTGGGGASFGQAWEINANGQLAPTTTRAIYAPSTFNASSTAFLTGIVNKGWTVGTSTEVCTNDCEFTTIASALTANWRPINVKQGTYSEALTIANTKTYLRGDSLLSTLQYNGSTQTGIYATGIDEFTLERMTLTEANAQSRGIALNLSNAALGRVLFNRFSGGATTTQIRDTASNSFYSLIMGNVYFNCGDACLELSGTQANANNSAFNRYRPMQTANGGTAISLIDARGFASFGDNIEGTSTSNGVTGLYVASTTREFSIFAPWIEANQINLQIDAGATRGNIFGGTITSGGTDYINNGTDICFWNVSITGQTLNGCNGTFSLFGTNGRLTASSTLIGNGTTTSWSTTVLNVGSDYVTNIAGDALEVAGNVLNVNDVTAPMLASADFGDFTCNGTTCSLDVSTGSWPFTPATHWGQAVQSTSTALYLTGSPFSLFASSTAAFSAFNSVYGTTTYASTTDISASNAVYSSNYFPEAPNSLVQFGPSTGNVTIDDNGAVNITSTGNITLTPSTDIIAVDAGADDANLSFGSISGTDKTFTFPNFTGTLCLADVTCAATTSVNSWSQLNTFSDGIIVTASSTFTGNATTSGMHGFGSIFLNGKRFTDIQGNGLGLSSGTLSATLGTTIGADELVGQGTICTNCLITRTNSTTFAATGTPYLTVGALISTSTNASLFTGNVAIATSSAGSNNVLNIGGAIGGASWVRFCREDGSFGCTFLTSGNAAFNFQATGSHFFSWSTGGTYSGGNYSSSGEKPSLALRNGSLTIGTSTPTTGGHLNIWGKNGLDSYLMITNVDTAFNTSPTGDIFIVNSTGRTGVGTTSPYSKLSIHAGATDTNINLFAVASSTATATTTLFSISNTAAVFNGIQFGGTIASSTSAAATYTVDWNSGNTARFILNQNSVFIINSTSSNPKDGHKYLLKLCQDPTGGRSATFATPGQLVWQGVNGATTSVATGANAVTQILLAYDGRTQRYDVLASSTRSSDARSCVP